MFFALRGIPGFLQGKNAWGEKGKLKKYKNWRPKKKK